MQIGYKKRVVIFILVGIFVFTGYCSPRYLRSLAVNGYYLLVSKFDTSTFIQETNFYANRTAYFQELMECNSLLMRVTGKRVVPKNDGVVIRLDNNYLYTSWKKIDIEAINDCASSVEELYKTAQKNDADFLYVFAPSKGMNVTYPLGIENSLNENCNNLLNALKTRNIPLLNLYDEMKKDNISEEDMFFVTDHHWKPEFGIWATQKICENLRYSYDFEYDQRVVDLDYYNQRVYEDWFLGSIGKKVGSRFTRLGADNISILTPKFKTKLVEEQPNKNEKREGDFTQTLLFFENIEKKDYYNLNPYAVYSGGDFRLQIVKNLRTKSNDKIVIVRDSFSCVITPFLSLSAKEVHIIDVRNYESYVGKKNNVHEYIEIIKPDYVIVCYNGVSIDDDRYNFN